MSIPKKSKQTVKKTSKVKAPAKKTTAKKSRLLVKPGKSSAKKTAAPRGNGTKRSAEELTKLKTGIVDAVTAAKGLTAEEIAKSLSTTTKALAMPLRQLRAAKTLSTTGTRRFLRYFPKGQAPKASATKKAA